MCRYVQQQIFLIRLDIKLEDVFSNVFFVSKICENYKYNGNDDEIGIII